MLGDLEKRLQGIDLKSTVKLYPFFFITALNSDVPPLPARKPFIVPCYIICRELVHLESSAFIVVSLLQVAISRLCSVSLRHSSQHRPHASTN